MTVCDSQRRGMGPIADLGRFVEQIKHLPHIHKRLPDFTIDRAKEVQWHGDLNHIGVDEDEIANCQIAGLNAHGGEEHHDDKSDSDQDRLAKVQECQ